MYGTMPKIKRILNPLPSGTYINGAILIGSSTGSMKGGAIVVQPTFAVDMLNEAGTIIDGMLNKRYKVPFGTPYPAEIRDICNRLAVGLITFAAKRYTADTASNFLYDKQQQDYQLAMSKLQSLADGFEFLKDKLIESYPKGEYDSSDKYHFKIPGSSDLRPPEGM